MSKIIDKLREAEAQRERIVAERKRLETEADAALAAREREEQTGRASAEAPRMPRADPEAERLVDQRRKIERNSSAPSRGSRTWFAIGVALLLCLAMGAFFFRQTPEPRHPGVFELKLDRSLESFAQHLKEKDEQ